MTEIHYNAANCANLNHNSDVFLNAGKSGSGITVTIGANVQSIPAYLFCPNYDSTSSSPKITNVVFEENSQCTTIGQYAFRDCRTLTNITIPESVVSIGNSALSDCSGLASIKVSTGNTTYHSEGNCLIETKTNTLVLVCKNSIIPKYVQSIGGGAFCCCSSLTSISIPNSVQSIGDSAFGNCSGLTSITIPNNVQRIGWGAFYGCNSLSTVFYGGTEASWDFISIAWGNKDFQNATRFYYSESQPELNADGTDYNGNYWHFVNGVPIVWKK